jgi:hypothetical protein
MVIKQKDLYTSSSWNIRIVRNYIEFQEKRMRGEEQEKLF